jgi:hypothetical protein
MLVVEHVFKRIAMENHSNLRGKFLENFCDHQVISTHIFQGFARVHHLLHLCNSLCNWKEDRQMDRGYNKYPVLKCVDPDHFGLRTTFCFSLLIVQNREWA